MKQNFIPLEKQSKRAQKEYNAARRNVVMFNTGTRVHKTDKHPSRARAKQMMIRREDF